jgi:hypothetical protein
MNLLISAARLLTVRGQFAIRPNIRNHSTIKRDAVIQQVAAAVGPKHQVDLKGYDHLIIVEVYKVRGPQKFPERLAVGH